MSLKIYAWEQQQFKDLYNIHLMPSVRGEVIYALAKFFDIQLTSIEFVTQRNGKAIYSLRMIKLPRKGCSVGLAVHELAHHYNFQKNGQRGHRKAFKKALIKLAIETRYELPKILKAVHHEQEKSLERTRA